VHHNFHHLGYTTKFNAALSQLKEGDLLDLDAASLMKNLDRIPEVIRQAVRNNGGGYVNHNLFWKILQPNPTDAILEPAGKSVLVRSLSSPWLGCDV
jgi:Fe-Mn family superoxide dismutase